MQFQAKLADFGGIEQIFHEEKHFKPPGQLSLSYTCGGEDWVGRVDAKNCLIKLL